MSGVLRKLWRWSAGFAATLIILLALLVGAFRLLVTQVAEYQQQIETWASEAAGVPIEVDKLDARWAIDGPELFFHGARLLSADRARVLLTAEQGSLGISLTELVRSGELRVGRLALRGARIDVERGLDGRIRLANVGARVTRLDLDAIPSGRFELQQATIGYRDLGSDHPGWLLRDVDLLLLKERSGIELEGRARLPAELGGRSRFELSIDGPIGDGGAVTGGVTAELEQLQIPGWHRLLPEMRLLPESGAGRLELTARLSGGELSELAVDAALRDLRPPGRPDDVYDRLAGRFELERNEAGWMLDATVSEFVHRGREWPQTAVHVDRRTDDDGIAQLTVAAGFVRLQDLLPVVALWPGDAEPRRAQLAALGPRGDLRDLSLQVTRERDGPLHYAVEAEFHDLGFEPGERHPGIQGLHGHLRTSETAGRVRIDTTRASYTQPWLFREPFDVTRARGTIVWRASPVGWRILSDHIEVDNDDIRTQSSVELTVPADGGVPYLDIQSRYQDVRVAAKSRYLPVGRMPEKVVAWLDRAVVDGYVPSGTFSYSGPTRGFLRDGKGELRAQFSVEQAKLDYMPGWPAVDGLAADVEFHDARLDVDARAAAIGNVPLEAARARFEDLREGVLELAGRSAAPLADIHGFLVSAPLDLGEQFARLAPAGRGALEIGLTLPVREISNRKIDAKLKLEDAELGYAGIEPRLTALGGTLVVTDRGIRGSGLGGQLFGEPLTIDIEPLQSRLDGGLLVRASGRIAVRTALAGRIDAHLAERLGGVTDYAAELRLPPHDGDAPERVELGVRSDLQGIDVALPAPLGKSAAVTRELIARLSWQSREELQLVASLAPDISLYGELSGTDGGLRLERGLLEFGDTTPRGASVEDGLVLRGSLAALDVDAWLALGEAGSASGLADRLTAIDIVAGELRYGRFGFADQRFQLRRQPQEWWLGLDGPQASGSMLLPLASPRDRPVIVALERLHLTPHEEPAARAVDPRALPGLDLHIADLGYRERRFGAVRARVRATPIGVELGELHVDGGSYTGEGSGVWARSGQDEQSELKLSLVAGDLSETLTALGLGDYLDAEHGNATMDLQWQGSPVDGLASVSGTVSVRIEDGQLLAVQPGAGRVFGLLSVAALPRRMALDFSDVFDKGLAFDEIAGDFVLSDGNAYTSNLLLKGPAAEIVIAGRTGLASRDYDQTAVVSGNVVGKALPVAGGLAGGPAVAAALLIFSEIFEKPLKGMTRVYYRIQGSWEDPLVERVAVSDFRSEPAPQPPVHEAGEANGPAASAKPGTAAPGQDGGDG